MRAFVMRALDANLTLYRHTLKRFRPAHVAMHRLMAHVILPLAERVTGFRTIPDDPFWFRIELLSRQHEAETVRQLARLVGPGMVVLDIGAHVGYYARLAARLVGPDGRVLAFEPHPRTFAVLQANVRRWPAVTPVQMAVAEHDGTAELYDYLMMSASGSLHYDETMRDLQKAHVSARDVAPRISTDFPVETFSVRTVPLDDFLAEQGIARVDVVKMDIEGAELSALRGMRATIARSPGLALIMEYNPQALKAFVSAPQAALDEVLALGFDRVQVIEADGALTDLTGDTAALEALTARLMDHMGVVNLLLTRSAAAPEPGV